jgi:predicted permease
MAMATLGDDLLHACRLWRRAPAFAVVVVCTIALAVGAATAVFSVVHGLLGPLPYPEPGRLVAFYSLFSGRGNPMGVSPKDFARWRQRAHSFTGLGAWRSTAMGFAVPGGEPERVKTGAASMGYFDVLGCPPLAGRLLRDSDFAPGAPPVVVLSRQLWQRRLGGDPRAVGRTVLLNGLPVTVAGVLNDRFADAQADVWRPFLTSPDALQSDDSVLYVVGRLAPGVSPAEAQREMESIAAELNRLRPDRTFGVGSLPLRDQLLETVDRGRLKTLLAAAAGLFLVACANLASLSFAWISWRRREIAVRVALGAAPRRIVVQLLAEALVLAAAGGVLGALLAATGLPVILGLNPGAVPRLGAVSVDGASLLFALAIALAAGIAVGIWPALDAVRPALLSLLGDAEGGRREGPPARWIGGALIAAEVAVAFVLLTCAGLSLRGLVRLSAVDPGFRSEERMTARIVLSEARYNDRRESLFYSTLAGRLRATPGFAESGVISTLPSRQDIFAIDFFPQAEGAAPPEQQVTLMRAVTPGVLAALGIPLLAGRDVTAADGPQAPWVGLVNETLARQVWPGRPAVGRTLDIPQENGTSIRVTLIGVVADFRHRLDAQPEAELYLPFAQWGVAGATVVVRTTAEPEAVDAVVRATVHALDPTVPVDPAMPFDSVVSQSLSPFRFEAVLFTLYATLALALAAVGVYGVISYSVARRRREIALRLALGARRMDILWMVCRQTLIPTAAGLAAGGVMAVAAGRFLAGRLFGVSAGDPAVFLTVLAVLLGVALCATAEPALRVAATDPADAMR